MLVFIRLKVVDNVLCFGNLLKIVSLNCEFVLVPYYGVDYFLDHDLQ